MKKKKAAKKAVKKKSVRKTKRRSCKTAKKKTKKPSSRAVKKASVSKTSIPKGASLEEVGVVTHYFPRVEAAVVKLTKGTLSLGDTIVLKGHTTDFKEKVDSIQLEHVAITKAERGQEIGLKVKSKVREHDAVYKIVG